jgi:hypothetical protein
METLLNASPITIARNTVLVIAIASVIGLVFSLRQDVIQGDSIFPATIPILFLFAGAIVGVELLHVSPFHLLWLFIVSLLLGSVAIMVPPIQTLSMSFLAFLAMTTPNPDITEGSTSQPSRSKKSAKSASKKSKSSSKRAQNQGFGD